MNNETISHILRNNLKVVPEAFDMDGKNFNCDCHLEISDRAYMIIGEGDFDRGKSIVENYLIETNGQI